MPRFQALADRVEIEALRGDFADAGMMRDHERFASLFTHDGVWRMPHIEVELRGRDRILAWVVRAWEAWECFVQTVHQGTIQVDGDTAVGRSYVAELGRRHDGASVSNHGIYHDRYQRTTRGWRFTERLYEIRYLDTTPLAGSPPHRAPAEMYDAAKYARMPGPAAATDPPGRLPPHSGV